MARVRSGLIIVAAAAVVVAAVLTLNTLSQPGGALSSPIDALGVFTTNFLSIFIEAAPFLLLGSVASGLVEEFIQADDLRRLTPQGALGGALAGALLGLFVPVGEGGVVVLVRRLFRKGFSVPAGIAFLLAAPLINPIAIAATLAAFGIGPVLWLRLGLTAIVAVSTGLVFSSQRQPHQLLRPTTMGGGGGSAASNAPWRVRLNRGLSLAVDEFFDIGRYLVAGALLAALVQAAIPRANLLAAGGGEVTASVALAALAAMLSAGSTVDAFVALSFAGSFAIGPVVAFLVYGAMVDIKSAVMFWGVFRGRAVAYLVLVPLVMTVGLAVALDLFTGG